MLFCAVVAEMEKEVAVFLAEMEEVVLLLIEMRLFAEPVVECVCWTQ